MTHAAIQADRLLLAVTEARSEHFDSKYCRDTIARARLDLLEGLATFVAKDQQYNTPRIINISAEDFALIAEPLRHVDTKGTTK